MVRQEPSDENLKVARLILRYVFRHPYAKDTSEGIAAWWLQQQRIEQVVEEVSRALALLVAWNLLIEREAPDRRTYYELNRQRITEITQFLEGRAWTGRQGIAP